MTKGSGSSSAPPDLTQTGSGNWASVKRVPLTSSLTWMSVMKACSSE
jgi:hypothetical protein